MQRLQNFLAAEFPVTPAPRPSAPKCQDCDRIFKPCVQTEWPLSFGREATRTWRKSTTSKDFFDNFGREFSLPTNWFGKLETSWIHFCKKIAATYKLLISPTFRPIFQIGPRTNKQKQNIKMEENSAFEFEAKIYTS